jgi:hypothetical protein
VYGVCWVYYMVTGHTGHFICSIWDHSGLRRIYVVARASWKNRTDGYRLIHIRPFVSSLDQNDAIQTAISIYGQAICIRTVCLSLTALSLAITETPIPRILLNLHAASMASS